MTDYISYKYRLLSIDKPNLGLPIISTRFTERAIKQYYTIHYMDEHGVEHKALCALSKPPPPLPRYILFKKRASHDFYWIDVEVIGDNSRYVKPQPLPPTKSNRPTHSMSQSRLPQKNVENSRQQNKAPVPPISAPKNPNFQLNSLLDDPLLRARKELLDVLLNDEDFKQ